MGYTFAIVRPSCATSRVSTATSFPSDFRSVPVIFVGHAFASVHDMVAFPASSHNWMVTGTRLITFSLIWLYQSQNLLSLAKTPFFKVTLPVFLIPGIFSVENSGLLPARYSIGCV